MSNEVDDLIGDETKPAKKPAKKAEAKPAAKSAKKAEKSTKKAEAADPSESNSAVTQALLKLKKATTYADFAEKNDFNIRSVRRAARALRDSGHLELEKDGQVVTMRPTV